MGQLQIGRTPIREAIRRLEQEGLVDVVPRRGVFVTNVNIRDLASLTEVRLVMETYGAGLAAERATRLEQDEAVGLIRELLLKPTDRWVMIELDQRIHKFVYRCAHNQFLADSLEAHYTLAQRMWFLALDRMKDITLAPELRALLVAITDGDKSAAEAAMRDHIESFESALRKTL
jgi:DNA-binding GntR family transcriptional regulator